MFKSKTPRFLYKYENNLKILFDSIINEETNKMLSMIQQRVKNTTGM